MLREVVAGINRVRDCTCCLSDFRVITRLIINITLATRMAALQHIEELNPEKE